MSDAKSVKPFLSLFCICGDAGTKTLGRMLKSVLLRADGAMVDEIVIGWNGKNDQALARALLSSAHLSAQPETIEEKAALLPAEPGAMFSMPHPSGVGVTILRQTWQNDFSIARNETMALCKGEWTMWLDSVTGDTPIAVRRKGSTFFEYIEIQDLVPECYRGKKTVGRYALGGWEALTHKGWKAIKYVKQHWVRKPVHRIVDDGDVRVTRDHSLFSGGEEVKGTDARPGVVLDHDTGVHGEASVTMSSELAEVWGFFAAEGSTFRTDDGRNFWCLYNTNRKLLNRYRKVLERAYAKPFKVVISSEKGRYKTCWRLLTLECRELHDWYRSRFYSAGGRKRVPREVLNATPEVMAAFVRGYELGDGHVRRVSAESKNLQQFATNSPILAAGLVYLYRRLGREFRALSPRADKDNIVSCVEQVGHWRVPRFSDTDLVAMRKLRASGVLLKDIAKQYNTDTSFICALLKGKRALSGGDVIPARRSEGVRHNKAYPDFEGWVFDISTEAGSFVGGVGDFILHNTDDIVSSAADKDSLDGLKAIEAVENDLLPKEERAGERGAGGGGSLREWLKQLAWNITCVRTPYDYMVNDQGKAVIRQFRRRLLRKECYLWHLPIHELAQPIPGLVESSVNTLGLLVRHYPEQESTERLMRNKDVLDAMQERKGSPQDTSKPIDYADARHAYDVASINIGLGDLAAADAAIRTAISRGGAKIDTYRYRLTRAHINITRGMYETAYAEAVAATGLEPEMPDAWFVAGECMSLLGQWAACISFIKTGESKPAAFQPVDFVVARDTKPRTMIAASYCELGKPELGLPYAEEAIRLHPTDASSLAALERARRETDKNKAISGVLDAVRLLVSKREVGTADALLKAADNAVTLRGIHWLPKYQELRAATNAGLEHLGRDRSKGDVPPPGLTLLPDEVYYDTKNGQPEDTESVVQHWREAGHMLHRVAVTPDGVIARTRPTKKRHITFYSPHAITQWDPYFPELYGLGGSESSVVYLAKELARRGYPVTVYCPTGAYIGCDLGFVWRSLTSFNMRDDHGLLVACRAPWVLRNPELKSPTFVWHQDNGYGSKWHWNSELDRRSVGSLHVSDWARAGLIRELGVADEAKHHTIGNGVPTEWCMPNWKKSFVRNPHRVMYASDPTRGLDTLLNCWPHIVEAVPDAELEVYGEMMTSQAMVNGTHSTQRELAFIQMKDKMNILPRFTYKGRIGQAALTEAMLSTGVYAYAGGLMPEGYGIALAQAAAAGCAVVYPQEGALPDIHSRQWMVPPVKSEEGAKQFLDTVVRAMTGDTDRLAVSQRILERHTWSAVADRLETVLKGV